MWDKLQPSRRDFLTLAAGAFAVAAVPVAMRSRARLHTRSLPVMATTAELAVAHSNERHAQAAMSAALREVQRIEQLMSRFLPASDVGRANALAGRGRVTISADTAAVINEALGWARSTGGGFDPALARVVDLWDVKHRTSPPPAAQVSRLAGRQLYRRIDLDDRSLFVSEADAILDLGGIACGHAVDCAVRVLREWGITSGYVNIGGDIYALGYALDGEPWRIGVRAPDDPDVVTTTVSLHDAAIATSGDYEQGYHYRGRRYHHIIDPLTAEPRHTSMHTVTIVADRCIDADAGSTAVFGMTAPAARALLQLRAPSARVVSFG